MDLSKGILVSICCATYNHYDYITDCLEGFLKQSTNFLFEILIYDDASTDGTDKIIKEYNKKYPELIYPIFQKDNQFSLGIDVVIKYLFSRARGKYIALCEGDDYWIDANKLQKQVDILEEKIDYGMVHTNGYLNNIQKNRKNIYNGNLKSIYLSSYNNSQFIEILLGKYNILTCSVCFRAKLLNEINISQNQYFLMGDTFLWLEIAHKSKIWYLPEAMVVHNILRESVSKSRSYEKILQFSRSGYEMEKYFVERYKIGKEIEEKINFRRNIIFLDIAFRGKLVEDGIEAYNSLKGSSIKNKINLISKLKYYSLKWPLTYRFLKILIMIIQKINNRLNNRIKL